MDEHLKKRGCYVGILDTGFDARNLTLDQLEKEAEKLGWPMLGRSFRRYRFCPICGSRLAWSPALIDKLPTEAES